MASKLSAATSTSLTCHFSVTLSQNSGLPRRLRADLAVFLASVTAEVSLQAAFLNQQQMQRKRKILRKSSTITYLRVFLPHEPPLLQPWVLLLLSLRPPFQLEDDSQPACKTATHTEGNATQHAQYYLCSFPWRYSVHGDQTWRTHARCQRRTRCEPTESVTGHRTSTSTN